MPQHRHAVQKRAGLRLKLARRRRHPHVLAATQGDRRPQHRKPQEQDGGQLIDPTSGLWSTYRQHDPANRMTISAATRMRQCHLDDARRTQRSPPCNASVPAIGVASVPSASLLRDHPCLPQSAAIFLQNAPRPRRRTCPSIARKTRLRSTLAGTPPDRRLANDRPLASRSLRSVMLAVAMSSRSLSAAAFEVLAQYGLYIGRATRAQTRWLATSQKPSQAWLVSEQYFCTS